MAGLCLFTMWFTHGYSSLSEEVIIEGLCLFKALLASSCLFGWKQRSSSIWGSYINIKATERQHHIVCMLSFQFRNKQVDEETEITQKRGYLLIMATRSWKMKREKWGFHRVDREAPIIISDLIIVSIVLLIVHSSRKDFWRVWTCQLA